MIGSHPATVTGHPMVPTKGPRIRSLPLAAMLCVLALSAVAAAPARADNSVPFQHVLFDGHKVSHCPGSTDAYCRLENSGIPTVVRLTMQFMGSQGNQSQTLLTVANDSNSGSEIVGFIGQLSGPFVRFAETSAGEPTGYGGVSCFPLGNNRAPAYVSCNVRISPGSEDQFVLTVQGTQPAMTSLDLSFGRSLSVCDFPPPGAALDARMADACTPPSDTRITQAQIDRNTALFRFTGRHASHFQCELSRNRKIMFNRSCQSPKPYVGPLPPGNYTFRVVGVNAAGFDMNPAVKKFTVG